MAPKSAADIQNIVNPPEGLRGEPGQKGMKYNVEHDPVAGGVQGDLSNVERNWREGFKKFHEDYKSATPERRKEIQDAARDAEAVINNMPEGPEKDEAIAGFAASREVLGSFLKGEGVEALKKRAKAHGEYGTASEVGFVAGGYASMYAVAQLHYNSLYTGRYKTVGRMAKPIAQFVGMITPGLNHKALTEIIEARKFLASSEGQKALKWGYNEWLKSLPKATVEGWARKGMEIPTFEQVVGYDARTATPGRMPKARDLTKSYLGQALHKVPHEVETGVRVVTPASEGVEEVTEKITEMRDKVEPKYPATEKASSRSRVLPGRASHIARQRLPVEKIVHKAKRFIFGALDRALPPALGGSEYRFLVPTIRPASKPSLHGPTPTKGTKIPFTDQRIGLRSVGGTRVVQPTKEVTTMGGPFMRTATTKTVKDGPTVLKGQPKGIFSAVNDISVWDSELNLQDRAVRNHIRNSEVRKGLESLDGIAQRRVTYSDDGIPEFEDLDDLKKRIKAEKAAKKAAAALEAEIVVAEGEAGKIKDAQKQTKASNKRWTGRQPTASQLAGAEAAAAEAGPGSRAAQKMNLASTAEAGGLVTDARSGHAASGLGARTPPPGATRMPALAGAGSQAGSLAPRPSSPIPPQLRGVLRELQSMGRGGRKQLMDALGQMGSGVRGAARRGGLGGALFTGFAVKGMFSNLVDNIDRGMNPVAAWGDATMDAVGTELNVLGEFVADVGRFLGTPLYSAMEYPIEKTLGLRKQPPRGLDKEGLGSWGGLFGGRQQYDAEGNPITHKVPPEGEPYFGRYWEPDPAGGWFSEGDPEQVAEEERGRRIAEERTRRQNELTMHGPYGDPSKEGTPSYAKDVLGQNWEQHTGADRRAPIRFDPRVERGAQLENLKQSLLGGVRAPASSADADTPWAGFDYTPHVPREELFSGVEPQPTGPVQPRGFHNLGPADQEYLRGWWNAPRLGGSSILQDQPLDPNPMYFDPNKPNPLSR